MRNVNPDEILKRSDYPNLTDKQFIEKVCEYCRYALDNLDNISESEKILQLQTFPKKQYEIFNLNVDGGKVFVLKTNEIYYVGEEDSKELYYSSTIAKNLCMKMKQVNESAISFVEEAFDEEIKNANKEIETLKELDSQEYALARFVYSSLEGTNIIEEYSKLNEENKSLKESLEKSEKNVEDLSNKLKVSLEEIERNKKALNIKNKNFFQKIAEKLSNM